MESRLNVARKALVWSPRMAGIACSAVLLVLPVWVDVAIVLVLLINSASLIGWTVLQLRWRVLRVNWSQSSSTPDVDSTAREATSRPFFSVHVPAHNEPPDMLRDTLMTLANQDYDRYEVVVIDNNTISVDLWWPIEAFCQTLGRSFIFMHRMDVRGAKAGALNIARQTMDPRTTHVVVVDADYQVSRDFLVAAAEALKDSGTGNMVDYVQFPQAYRSSERTTIGLTVELTDYFDRHATFANDHSAMLLTGTLSIVSIHALDSVGGWPTSSVTEDAELGMRLQSAGFRGRFINCVYGQGLLPPGVAELRGQRHRWIVGNLQTLIRSLHSLSSFTRDRRLSMVAQLTAWCSFTFVPAAALFLLTARAGLGNEFSDAARFGLHIAAGTICWQAVINAAVLLETASPQTFVERLEACMIRWSLTLSSGWSTLSALAMVDIAFLKTSRCRACESSQHLMSIAIAVLLLLLSFSYLLFGFWLVAVAVMQIAMVPIIERWVDGRWRSEKNTCAAAF